MCPSRWRDEAEQTLIDSPDYGRDLIRIDLLEITQPWPTYDTFDADKIAAYAKAGGLRIDDVIRYEKATQDRPTVLASLEVAKAQQALEDAEAAALSVPA
jgi:hypothetical protein